MRSALLWEGAFAVFSIVLVTLGLWLVVRKFSVSSVPVEDAATPNEAAMETIKVR